jgi:beta-glucosidase/6-phospho-beta-glucosidase/beta-galactosidase
VRDGLRWHRIETRPGWYDWSSWTPMLQAANRAGTQVIWDLMHYGWPDDLDIWGPSFVERFARFAGAAARVARDHSDQVPFYAPVNEISFLAWAGGDAGYLNPFAQGRSFELKVQLARASLAGMRAILAVDPRARFVHCDPIINIAPDPARPQDIGTAEAQRLAQFQGWDLLAGSLLPELGGELRFLDIVGVNFYHNNQWIHDGATIERGAPLFRPLRQMLAETHGRYGRPIFVAETGIEAEQRPSWFAYVAGEVAAARAQGVPVEGICLYPVLNHAGWDDDRPCHNGLLEHHRITGERGVFQPLADEIRRQRQAHPEWH